MVIFPSTNLKVLRGVPLDNTYKDTLTFADKTAQMLYFSGKVKHSFSACTPIRQNNSIKVEFNPNSLYDCNYIMFQNENFGDKWFYAFIKEVNFINTSVTEIIFEIDVMQTWYFDYTVKPSFVEREHPNTDNIGDNLVPEGLETGDYTYEAFDGTPEINEMAIVVCSTVDDLGNSLMGGNYTGIYSGACLYAWSASNFNAVSSFLQEIDTAGKGEAVSCIFLMPKAMIPNFVEGELVYSPSPEIIQKIYPKRVTSIDGYAPKNKKLLTYPFNFLTVSTLNGASATYHYEYFSDATQMEFTISGNVAPSPTVFLLPNNYKGVMTNYDEALKMKGYPLCSWTYGAFSNWLAQNAMSLPLSIIGGSLAVAGGIATANPLAVGGGLLAIGQSMGQVYQHSIQPPQSRGSQGDGANVALGIQTFAFMPMCIRKEFAERIDNFFSMFGYKTNNVKMPNIKGRRSWNYVKTIDVTIVGSLSVDAMAKIKACFNSGITFWHGDYVGDYTRDNSII